MFTARSAKRWLFGVFLLGIAVAGFQGGRKLSHSWRVQESVEYAQELPTSISPEDIQELRSIFDDVKPKLTKFVKQHGLGDNGVTFNAEGRVFGLNWSYMKQRGLNEPPSEPEVWEAFGKMFRPYGDDVGLFLRKRGMDECIVGFDKQGGLASVACLLLGDDGENVWVRWGDVRPSVRLELVLPDGSREPLNGTFEEDEELPAPDSQLAI